MDRNRYDSRGGKGGGAVCLGGARCTMRVFIYAAFRDRARNYEEEMKWHTRLGLSLENDLLSPPSRPWSGSIPIESPCWIAYNYVRSSSASPLRRRRPQKIRPERKICNFDNQSHERRLIFTIQRAFIYIYISHGNNDETLLLLLENPFDTKNLAIFCIFVFIIYTKVFIHQVSLQLFYIFRLLWDVFEDREAKIIINLVRLE